MRVILSGGPSELERRTGAAIAPPAPCRSPIRSVRDTLPQLLALLARATVLLSPDSGPAHMATMVGTPVIGLYAATNPARSGPYLSGRWCVNAYAEAARTSAAASPRSCRGPQDRRAGRHGPVRIDEVTAKLDELLGSRP